MVDGVTGVKAPLGGHNPRAAKAGWIGVWNIADVGLSTGLLSLGMLALFGQGVAIGETLRSSMKLLCVRPSNEVLMLALDDVLSSYDELSGVEFLLELSGVDLP